MLINFSNNLFLNYLNKKEGEVSKKVV